MFSWRFTKYYDLWRENVEKFLQVSRIHIYYKIRDNSFPYFHLS